MGKHSQSDANFRHKYPKYPILATGAVLAVAGVSAFLVAGGAPTIAVLVGGEKPAVASSAAGGTHGSAQSGGGSALSASSSGVHAFLPTGVRTHTRFTPS